MSEWDDLRRSREAATPGPWSNDGGMVTARSITPGFEDRRTVIAMFECDDQGERDAAYIAAANPSVILRLIAERDGLAEQIKEARRVLDVYDAGYAERALSQDREGAGLARMNDAAREDAALGAAWRRCEAALPENGMVALQGWPSWSAPDYSAALVMVPRRGPDTQPVRRNADTPTAALEALAEALEARRAAG